MLNTYLLTAVVASFKSRGFNEAPKNLIKLLSLTPALFTISIFLFSVYSPNLYDSKRIIQIFFLFIITTTFIFIPLKLSIYKVYFIIFLLTCAILSINNFNIETILYLLHYIFLFSFIALGAKIKKELKTTFLSIFLLNLALISCSILNLSIYAFFENTVKADDIIYGFNNIRFFNQFQTLSFPVLIYFLNNNKISRIVFFILFLNITLLLITGARGAIVSCMIITLLGVNLRAINQEKGKTILKATLSALILFCLYSFFIESDQTIGYTFRASSSSRIEIWLDLIRSLSINEFFLGNGIGSYINYNFGVRHPHNSILQLVYELGVIPAFVIVGFVLRVIYKSIKNNRDGEVSEEHQTCLLALISMLILSFFSGVIVMPIPQTFVLIFFGVLISNSENAGSRSEIFIGGYFLKIILTLILLIYLASAFITYKCKDNSFLGPNYWAHGQFTIEYCNFSF
ncbi:O-antigen ligase family protein [Pseudoalteromonas sp. ACER1]|uniref:O-antigen ligase family protein n=1 Tax=unclassified Pseudoalteromonas TaxID=194690 RepID=UPI001F23BC5D|nr:MULTISPECIES: O-antigen ligase family protein [unclassified Pseudoalteromonas]MCF2845954.1 O-antigen ligase family protein [Pseudoalteromonas sp. PAST1]MCO7209437.1 O-antigen ligase family protein [Pseudoalteromonas sp. ACER1]